MLGDNPSCTLGLRYSYCSQIHFLTHTRPSTLYYALSWLHILQITNLVEQLEQFREELENKNEEVQQLHMQLEIQRKEAETRLQELEQENKALKGEVENTQHEHPQISSSKLPNNKSGKTEELLLLKDQEIDLLNEQITKLQIQLETATDNKVIEKKSEQIKEYKSQIKCLKSDQEQLKKNSEEEIEKLNEVIEKLQEELSRIEQKVAMDFTDKVQYEDVVDTKEIGQGDAPFADREEENVEAIGKNTSVEHERRNEIAPVSSESEEMQLILQNMEFKLIELQGIVKKKDEEIVTLQKQSLVMKDLEETVQRLQIELEEKKSKELESSRHKPSLDCPENLTLPLNTEGTNADETLMPKEVATTKVERQQLQDDLEHKVKFSEMPARKQGDDKVRIERLTEELREKTAQYLAVEALLASVQETSKDAIHRLEIQLQDLQRTVHEKDSQLMELTNTSPLLDNQEIERLNEEVKILQQKLSDAGGAINGIKKGEGETLMEDTETSWQKVDQDEGELSNLKAELEKTRMEMDVLEKELEQYKLLQQPIDITNVEVSKERKTSIEDEQ
ncbi:hypothetical protein GDO81_024555, partial [Engystomops pustulosus]